MSLQERRELNPKESELQIYGFFDIDDTLTEGNTTVFFSKFLFESGDISDASWFKISSDIETYRESSRDENSYFNFANDILNHLAESLKGTSVDYIGKKAEDFFNLAISGKIDGYKICDFSKDLVKRIKKKGIAIAISGSPEEILAPIVKYLTFDGAKATVFEKRDGYFTGKVVRNLAVDAEKKAVISKYLENTRILESYAFGDSTHDIPLLEAVGNSFVLGNNPNLQNIAIQKGWTVCKNGEGILEII